MKSGKRYFLEKLSRFYTFYMKIYPYIDNLRGSFRFARTIERVLMRFGLERVDDKAEGIFEREWDNLIVLDACRSDLYDEVNGETESRFCLGSKTPEFLARNFEEKNYDIVYISANPFVSPDSLKKNVGKEDPFVDVYDVYNTDWSDEEGTVPPENVIKHVRSAEKLFPDKKKIIHFMQPHWPFVGGDLNAEGLGGVDKQDVWSKSRRGVLDKDEVWKAYKENLEYVMSYVDEAADILSGKTVVTSDHGNLVGEYNLYGHPSKGKVRQLREVPWDVLNN